MTATMPQLMQHACEIVCVCVRAHDEVYAVLRLATCVSARNMLGYHKSSDVLLHVYNNALT